jgi:hypothetical protein
MKRNAVLIGILTGTMLATPVLAASDEACLPHNRLMNWRALDESTLVMTDIQYNRYTVHMEPRCQGVTNGAARLVFRTWQNLECLRVGEIITVTSPGLGQRLCAVASVQAGAPANAPG